jgi:hypothetical protein
MVVLTAVPLAGQPPLKRTPWGDPDLQGVYTFSTFTPLQRPQEASGKVALTEAELKEQEERDEQYTRDDLLPRGGADIGAGYNDFWTRNERGRRTGKTSLIEDPADGRLPALTPEGQRKRDILTEEARRRRIGDPPNQHAIFNHWSELDSFDQCISRAMPRVGQLYNHGTQILQVPGYVVILYESMHNARIIPLDGSPHLPDNVRLWDGDSRGRWEGDTLVVDWTNFDPRQEFAGATQGNMRITERFRRVDENTIHEEVTVEDPTTWTRNWTYVLPWRADDPNYQAPEHLYEYACHEGNYRMMENTLLGSRALKARMGLSK